MSSLEHPVDEEYPFSQIALSTPVGVQGGAYFSKLRIGGEPLLVQTPKCSTKSGVHATGKKVYCDLMFNNDEDKFLNWLKQLEERIQSLIYEKRDVWFHTEMDYDSIIYHWQGITRLYKGTNQLLRCFVPKPKGLHAKQTVQIFNEEEEPLTLDDVQSDTTLISILEVTGLRFTSTSFLLEFCLRQVMVLADKPVFDKCLIKANSGAATCSRPAVEEEPQQAEPQQAEPQQAEPQQAEPQQAEPQQAEPQQAEPQQAEPQQAEPPQAEPQQGAPAAGAGVPVALGPMGKSLEKQLQHISQLRQEVPGNASETVQPVEEGNKASSLEGKTGLPQVNLKVSETGDSLTLRKPSEVYVEIYRVARRKARAARRIAMQAYLEAKRIRSAYLLDEMDISSDEDDLDDCSDISEMGEL
jgi:hypothetical protein